jgi:Ca-activated chloride channel family protein
MNLIVSDSSNRSVEDIRQEDVQLTEDSEARKITFFARDERPLRYAIALDSSGSFRSLLPGCLAVARALIENNRPNDETMIVSFVSSDKIDKLHDFTTDKAKLLDSLNLVRIEGGQTAVVDAVHAAVEATATRSAINADARRAVVLLTDGEDRNSFYSSDQLMKLLREKDVQMFVIGIVTQLDKEGGFIRKSARERGENLLNSLAQETGGQVFFPKDLKELAEAAQQINKHNEDSGNGDLEDAQRDDCHFVDRIKLDSGWGYKLRCVLRVSVLSFPEEMR